MRIVNEIVKTIMIIQINSRKREKFVEKIKFMWYTGYGNRNSGRMMRAATLTSRAGGPSAYTRLSRTATVQYIFLASGSQE